jgi:hypothetical protein
MFWVARIACCHIDYSFSNRPRKLKLITPCCEPEEFWYYRFGYRGWLYREEVWAYHLRLEEDNWDEAI